LFAEPDCGPYSRNEGDAGVTATGSIDDVIATGADCVLYMPLFYDLDDVSRRLAAGMNVVTTCGQFHHSASDAVGLPLDSLQAGGELGTAARTVQLAAGTLEAGTVGAQRITVAGMRDGGRC
jgi:4-hydroxy-tetrahydrodipicolinate reductase